MPWITDVDLRAPLKEGGLWITLSPLGFQTRHFFYPNGKAKYYLVPARYATDLATVPRLPLVYWLVGNRGVAAAVIHDFTYDHGMRLGIIESRLESDLVYREILLEMGVSEYLATAMFKGVRIFGASHFCDSELLVEPEPSRENYDD